MAESSTKRLRIALPKGSLQEPTLKLLANAGYNVYTSSRGLRPGSNDHEAAMDETVIKSGNPVAQILTTAEEKRCDLIVMGTRGHGALMDTMMGSTTSRVTRRSTIPVLSIRLPK